MFYLRFKSIPNMDLYKYLLPSSINNKMRYEDLIYIMRSITALIVIFQNMHFFLLLFQYSEDLSLHKFT